MADHPAIIHCTTCGGDAFPDKDGNVVCEACDCFEEDCECEQQP